MGQTIFRANLSAMAFPFLSELSGRTIVVKQLDQNYTPQLSNKDDLDKDIGVPQLYYCHNVIATAQGYQSIDYESLIAGVSSGFAGVLSVLESSTGNKAYIGYTTDGKFYYSKDPFYSWTYFTTITAAAGKQITSAYINGLTYIYVANDGCYKFDFTTNSFTAVTLTGLTAANILGILAVQGYLIAWASDAIAWSSLLDPTDFVPSLATGAGGGSVQGAKGSIVACVSHTIGLVVYTNQNAVAAPASNNARYPFNFRELVSSGGIASLDMVTYDANSGNHYTYTTSGLQLISLQQTQTVIPEVTDFLAGSVFEDFNDTTNTLSTQELTHTLRKRLSLISDRYLIISYGITEFTHALIYDLALKRWGKLKFTHVQVFEFSLLTAETVETPRKSIALLSSAGDVHVVKIDSMNLGSNGVLLIGKYQLVRSRVTQLQSIDLENIPEAASVTCINCYATDGKNLIHETGFLQKAAGLFRRYLFHAVGVNHSVLLKGAFHLVSLVVSVTPHGRR